MVARTVLSMPSICTRNIVLGSASTISPSTSIFSSFCAIYLTKTALGERGRGHGKTRLPPRLGMVAEGKSAPQRENPLSGEGGRRAEDADQAASASEERSHLV